jgi:hypothetical protein
MDKGRKMITLKTLYKASEQEIFDQIASHLLTQNAASQVEGVPAYRDSQGRESAAGSLMADDEYSINFEGDDWLGLIRNNLVVGIHSRLVTHLEHIHDHREAGEWREELATTAQLYGLDSGVVKQ